MESKSKQGYSAGKEEIAFRDSKELKSVSLTDQLHSIKARKGEQSKVIPKFLPWPSL